MFLVRMGVYIMSTENLMEQIKALSPEQQGELANSILDQLRQESFEEDDIDLFQLDIF